MDLNLSINPTASSDKTAGVEKVIILGAGPAGMSAALYAARAELSPLVITGLQVGGQAAITHTIENYPGFPLGIHGQELSELFQKQAENFGARFEFDTVTRVDFSSRPFKVATYGGELSTETIILSTGAAANKLKIPGERELTGKGVSYCGTCDGWFFKEKSVVVVGGGDSALEEALFLTRYVKSVNIVHRRNDLRAGVILENRAKANPKISFTWDTILTGIVGDKGVTSVLTKNVKTGINGEIPIDGVFIFIGHTPNTDILNGQIGLDEKGYVRIDEFMRTNVEGVYAAGEVADPHYRQVVTSAGMGAAAAIQVTRFLEEQNH
jgi:thioredoxin reductase (NADPH)